MIAQRESSIAALLRQIAEAIWPRYFLALSLLLAALALNANVSQAGGCILWNHLIMPDFSLAESYIDFPSSNYVNGRVTAYKDSGCTDAHDLQPDFSPGGAVYASNRDTAWAICEAKNSKVIDSIHHPGSQSTVWLCMLGEEDKSTKPQKPRKRSGWLGVVHQRPDADAALAACKEHWPSTNKVEAHHQSPNAWHCLREWTVTAKDAVNASAPAELPMSGVELAAASGMASGIEFKRVSSAAVGIQSVIDMGFLDAVDVWSNVGDGAEICFPQAGSAVLLDASTSPRKVLPLNTNQKDGATCVSIDRAGTVVLVNQSSGAQTTGASQSGSSSRDRPTVAGTNDSVDSATSLQNCQVRPQVRLKLRAEPWGSRLGAVPAGATVTATERTGSWFKVSYGGKTGWIAAWLTTTTGDCDFAG